MKTNSQQPLVEYVLTNQENYYRLAYSYVKNKDDALDIVHESICKAMTSRHTPTQPEKLYQEFTKDMADLKANGGGHMGVDSGYEVKTDNEQILSIGRWVVNTVGSSSTTMKYDTVDKQKEILITLPSLFKDDSYIKVISENIKQQMLEQMKADPDNKIYWVKGNGEEPVFDCFETITRDQNFYINKNGKLVISFDKYEVAPGFMGVVEFEIPTPAIAKSLVSNEYIK